MNNPTLRDVAHGAGVHPGTASRALNPDTRTLVNTETARRVIKVARQLGYTPNPMARGLKRAKSATIGIVIPDITNPLFPPIVRGIEQVLEAGGYTGFIVNTDNDADRERTLMSSLLSRQVEGFVVGTALLEHPFLHELDTAGVAMVMVNRRTDAVVAPSVGPDDTAGVEYAVRHLVSLGHRRVAHLAGPSNTSTGVVRSRAFRSAARDLGLVDDPRLTVGCSSWSDDAGADAMRRLLASGVKFSAIVAGNDLIAVGCYGVMAERGIRCPEDLSIVGFNDMHFVDKLGPPLTTVHFSHQEVGTEAAHMLLDRLEDPTRPSRSVLLPVSLIARGSTAAAPATM